MEVPSKAAKEMEDAPSEDEEEAKEVLDDDSGQESVQEAHVDIHSVDLNLAQDQIDEMSTVVEQLLNKSKDANEEGDGYDAGYVAATLPELADDDAEDDDSMDESENATTPQQEAAARKLEATVKDLIKAVTKEADTMANPSELEQKVWSWIIGDAFHVMDQIKVLMHHELKAAYFHALRASIFILDAGDLEKVKMVLKKKGKSWNNIWLLIFDT